ncbi:MAG: CotH kinase family protein [Microthrixaceae bacterium]
MTPQADRTDRRARVRGVLAVAAIMIAAGCTPNQPGTPTDDDQSTARNVRVELVAGGAALTWDASPEVSSFEVDWRRVGTTTWSSTTVTGRHALVTGQVDYASYEYRVRAAPSPATPEPGWSGTKVGTFYRMTLPVISIDTGSTPIVSKDDYVDGRFTLDPNGATATALSGDLEIKGRGNTTWDQPKKPYRVKLATKAPLLGMPSSRHWVLLANYADQSQIRTTSAQAMASMTSIPWSPRSAMAELVLNGQYQGVYQVIEQIRIDPQRVDIDEMEPADITGGALTGGYLFEVDFRNEPGSRNTPRGAQILVKEPDELAPEQDAYVDSVLQRFEAALFAPNFADPAEGYRRYVDIDSLVDSYLVSEFTMQVDAFYSSTYFYKPRGDERFHFGPMWDFDMSQAPTTDLLVNPWPPDMAWVRNPLISFNRGGASVWLARLFQDPTFVTAVHDRWQQLKDPFLAQVEAMDDIQGPLMPAITVDAVRWNRGSLRTYHYAANIQTWMRQRWNWMNATM